MVASHAHKGRALGLRVIVVIKCTKIAMTSQLYGVYIIMHYELQLKCNKNCIKVHEKNRPCKQAFTMTALGRYSTCTHVDL